MLQRASMIQREFVASQRAGKTGRAASGAHACSNVAGAPLQMPLRNPLTVHVCDLGESAVNAKSSHQKRALTWSARTFPAAAADSRGLLGPVPSPADPESLTICFAGLVPCPPESAEPVATSVANTAITTAARAKRPARKKRKQGLLSNGDLSYRFHTRSSARASTARFIHSVRWARNRGHAWAAFGGVIEAPPLEPPVIAVNSTQLAKTLEAGDGLSSEAHVFTGCLCAAQLGCC